MLALGNKLAPLLYHMKWTVVAARDGYFVSSDNPVVREVHHESVSSMYGDGGFMNPTAEVTFPLSPKKLFLASWREASRLSELPSVLVVRANQCRASQSNRYLYAHVKDARVLDLAALFCDSRSGMTLSDVDPQKFARTAGRSGHA